MSAQKKLNENIGKGLPPFSLAHLPWIRIFFINGLISLVMLASGCGNSGSEVDKPSADEVGEPPSVSGKKSEATTVELTEREADELDIQTETVGQGNFTFKFSAPGEVRPAPDYVASVSAPVNGRIANVYANEGQTVKKGEILLELESLEYADMLASFMEAQAEVTYRQQQQDRINKLVDQNISPQRELEKVQANLSRAQVQARAARSRLQALGISTTYLKNLDVDREEQPLLQVRAPISGRINEHMIELGQSVNAYERMMNIIDNSKVLVKGFISPEDAPMVSVGDEVTITSRKNDERNISSEITSINPALDRENRSIAVNIIISTRNEWPVIGQTVRLSFSGETPDEVINVPLSAVQYEGKQATVFVKRDELTFEKRVIELRKITSEAAIVDSGIEAGEEVAVTQVFSLKAKEKFEEFAD